MNGHFARNDSTIGVGQRRAGVLLPDVHAFHDDAELLTVDFDDSTRGTFVVAGNDLNNVAFFNL